jgi:aminopeptidase
MLSIHEKYAQVLINYSLDVHKGHKLLIVSSYLAEPLVRECYKEAIKAGAFPELQISINGTDKAFFDYASKEQLEYVSPLKKHVYENYDRLLHIEALFNPKELQNVDPAKKQIANASKAGLNKIFMQRSAQETLKWTLCVFPTNAMAQESGMSISEYEDFVYNACYLYEDDPKAKWESLKDEQQRIVDFLNSKKQMRFVGEGTDITFSTAGKTWINSGGTTNMPSGEIFTAPGETSVNGKIRFSYPGIYMGQEIEDISLEVKDGLVVGWNALKGKQLLDKIMEIPGARRFGEAAIGTNYSIKKFTRNMLFDEKIGGTIHMALGAAYPESGGTNESSVHWDLLADMHANGKIYADEQLIYKDGKFII